MKARGREKMAKYKSENKRYVVYQRVLAIVALAGLFACGLMVGFAVNGAKKISSKISQIKTAVENTLPDKTCAAVEKVLEAKLNQETEDTSCEEFWANQFVYADLVKRGCPENQDKYRALYDRNNSLIGASCSDEYLQYLRQESGNSTDSTCEKITSELLRNISNCYNSMGNRTNCHIENAQLYANVVEYGCPDKVGYYKELAEQELSIARALQSDSFNDDQTIDVIETYKKIQMQAAAEEVFEKMKKLTNPAIDFILQVEKIINE